MQPKLAAPLLLFVLFLCFIAACSSPESKGFLLVTNDENTPYTLLYKRIAVEEYTLLGSIPPDTINFEFLLDAGNYDFKAIEIVNGERPPHIEQTRRAIQRGGQELWLINK